MSPEHNISDIMMDWSFWDFEANFFLGYYEQYTLVINE